MNLKVKIKKHDIYICHRLRKSSPTDIRARPMIVRFSKRRTSSEVLAAKANLKNSHIYVNEHLTKNAGKLFASARRRVKYKSLAGAWTRNGKLHVRLNDGKQMVISNQLELDQFH